MDDLYFVQSLQKGLERSTIFTSGVSRPPLPNWSWGGACKRYSDAKVSPRYGVKCQSKKINIYFVKCVFYTRVCGPYLVGP